MDMSSRISTVLTGIGSIAIVAIITLMWVATCWTPVRPTRNQYVGPQLQLVEVDTNDPRHRKIADALASAWMAADRPPDQLDLVIAQSPDLNAASYGSGAFLFWSGVGDLPEWAVEAIAAHEVAHDVLLHSRRTRDLAALMDFVAELLGILGGADYRSEATLRDWLHTLTLPGYTRAQELEADQTAIRLLDRLGYADPGRQFGRTLQILRDRYGDSGGGFFDSHPSISERMSESIGGR